MVGLETFDGAAAGVAGDVAGVAVGDDVGEALGDGVGDAVAVVVDRRSTCAVEVIVAAGIAASKMISRKRALVLFITDPTSRRALLGKDVINYSICSSYSDLRYPR